MSIPAPLTDLDPARFETPAILRKLASASRALAELKGAAGTIPRQDILINTLHAGGEGQFRDRKHHHDT